MSGAELYLAVLGAVIPVVQAAIAAKDRSARPREARVQARDIVELHDGVGQEWFSLIYSNLQIYQDVVEPTVDEKDRIFASNVRKSIYRTVKESQATAQELRNASKPEDIGAIKNKLEEYAKYLNNFQISLMNRLLLQQYQRLGRDGGIAFVQTTTAPSTSSGITLRSGIGPIKVSYDQDPELDWPISKGDPTVLESLFDPHEDNAAPTSRPSLALLLACRERLPQIVKLCLDYSADPTVTGEEDGLGAIHNAIGTADRMDEKPETVEILKLLIREGVEPSAPDSTEEQLRPLHRAVMTKNVSATKFLLEKDPGMVNLVDAGGMTALYRACSTPNQKKALIEELVDRDADFAGMSRPPMPDCDGQEIARYLDQKNLK